MKAGDKSVDEAHDRDPRAAPGGDVTTSTTRVERPRITASLSEAGGRRWKSPAWSATPLFRVRRRNLTAATVEQDHVSLRGQILRARTLDERLAASVRRRRADSSASLE